MQFNSVQPVITHKQHYRFNNFRAYGEKIHLNFAFCILHFALCTLFQSSVFNILRKQVSGKQVVGKRGDDGQAVWSIGGGVGIDDHVIRGVIVNAVANRIAVFAVINEVVGV